MELVIHSKWKELADAEYSGENPVLPQDGSVVFVHMEHIYQFFKDVARTDNRYILISADSDYCLTEQAKHPVWADMQKWFNFIPVNEQLGYSPITIPSRCCPEFCKVDDAFSVKVYSFTRATFDVIPENIVHWYSTNVDFDAPGIEHIPFGIPNWSAGLIARARENNLHNGDKFGIYVNFQSNTLERVQLKNRYRNGADTFYVDKEVSHEEFVSHLLGMKCVISPPGNGFDCFRTLESIYCGAIPVLLDTPYNKVYQGLGVLVDNLFTFPLPDKGIGELDNTVADFGYWRQKISKKAIDMRLA